VPQVHSGPPVPSDAFDYEAPEHVEHQATLTLARDAIRKEMERCAKSIVTIGWNLQRAKDECGHGIFLKWLDAEFGWSHRTAQRFMRAAEVFDTKENATRVSQMEPTAIYLLSAPSTPKQAREQVLTRLDAGERIPVEEIKDILRQCKGEVGRPTDRVERVKSAIMRLSVEEMDRLRNWFLGDNAVTFDAAQTVDVPALPAGPLEHVEADEEVDEPDEVEADEPDYVEEVVEQAAPPAKPPEQSLSELDQATLRIFQEHAAKGGCPWIGPVTSEMLGLDEDSVDRLAAGGHIVQSATNPHSYGVLARIMREGWRM
jgi:hypothetical protein